MMDRVGLLREMGLGPVWALRQKAAAPVLEGLSPPAAAPLAVVSPATMAPAAPVAMNLAVVQRADWMFVGEAPDAEGDALGDPFVGQAGTLFDAMLASIGLRRGENIHVANIAKNFSPNDRMPESVELPAPAACLSLIEQQIELTRPRLIVALGKPAAQTLLARETSIAAARGTLHDYRGIPLIVTYHPAYLLRNLLDKAKAWEDLVFMRRTMRRLKAVTD